MNWPQSPLKWLGLVLVVAGLSVIPLTLLVLQTFQVAFDHQQFRVTLAMLLAIGDGFLVTGVLIMMPRFSLIRRRVNSSPQPEH